MYSTIGIALAPDAKPEERDYTMLTNSELQVPRGYRAERAFIGGDGLCYDTAEPQEFLTFHVGRLPLSINTSGPMNGEDGVVPVVGHGFSVAAFAVTIEVLCTRTSEALDQWRLATYNAIMAAYHDQLTRYEAELARIELNAQNGVGPGARNPALNREVERSELKRAALTLLTGQHFDAFDATRGAVPPFGYPEIDLAEAETDAPYVRFLEQAFEWSNISYSFYPYFWGRKSEWPALLRLDDGDLLFGRFLQAGAARVQIPVRPGFEKALSCLLAGQKPWNEGECDFLVDEPPHVSIVDEIKEEQLGAFTRGAGRIAVQQGATAVTGTDTAFDKLLHEGREMVIRDRVHRVAEVVSTTDLRLEHPYPDATGSDLTYSFGARYVGDPWEVRVPTSLVYLQQDATLPDPATE
jgi:hypothetical protein